jgi:ribose transport system permease protein
MEKKNIIKEIFRKYGLIIGFFMIFFIFAILSPYFLKGNNISNILVQSAILAIVAVGQTVVMLTGGIDLSVGSIVAVSSMVSAILIVDLQVPIFIGIIAGIAVGAIIGLINGLVVSYGRIPPFIATLGMMSVGRGIALSLKKGQPIPGIPNGYENIATLKLMNVIPVMIIYMVIIYIITYFLLARTKPGRYIYAIGGNRSAARLSGIRVNSVEILAYVVSGLLSGVGGILLTARLDYATPISGNGYELDVIAATVIGGTSLVGGEGMIFGTLLGAVLIGVLRNGLTLLNILSYYQQIIIGIVIIGAVFMDRFRSRSEI